MDKMFENNQVTVTGEIVSDYRYSHEVFGESFYMVDIATKRLSGIEDVVPLMIPERLINIEQICIGRIVHVNGQFRSHNQREGDKNRLVLYVFARDLEFVDELPAPDKNNQIYLEGYICKKPTYRKTPLGRKIADLLIAVNRSYGKSDYIPCLCWGRNAGYVSGLEPGDQVCIHGRIQSREYTKWDENGNQELRMAYEVSISKISISEEM